jgi:hypothetical protein
MNTKDTKRKKKEGKQEWALKFFFSSFGFVVSFVVSLSFLK